MSAGLFLGTTKMYEQSLPFCCLACVGDDEAGFGADYAVTSGSNGRTVAPASAI